MNHPARISLGWSLLLSLTLGSCGLGTNYFLSGEELARFEAAGPIQPELDPDQILDGLRNPGPYTVVPGDLLGVQGPKSLFDEPEPDGLRVRIQRGQLTRVNADHSIHLPVLGKLDVKGMSLLEIEKAIASAAYPKFVKEYPAIVAQVVDYHKERVTVVGAVERPGIVPLRGHELSLFGALTAAGGISRTKSDYVAGARTIRIRRPGTAKARTLVLPVRGLNMPTANVALRGGETIEVQRWEPDTFTVIGMVQKPGAFSYPPDTKFNLMQALAHAGGVDVVADPPYATVFRKDASGEILPATFHIAGVGLVQSSGLSIKPGDVIVVEQTAASWTRALLSKILRVQFGYFANRSDVE